MRFRLNATPKELAEKSGKLVEELSELFQFDAPDLAESLEKALPAKEPELKYPVLRELQAKTAKLYREHMDQMLQAIGKVLDQGLGKSLEHDHTKPVADKDAVAYQRAREVLIRRGWEEVDFQPGGPLYGWSANQLLDLADRGKKE